MFQATAQFPFHMSDWYAGNTKFAFKASLTADSERAYKFSYLPYGQYSSYMMLDYILSKKSERQAALYDLIYKGIREQEALGDAESFIVFGDRENTELSGYIHDSEIYGFRPITRDKLLHIMKKRTNAKRASQRKLGIHSSSKQATRRIEHRMKYVRDQLLAERDSQSGLFIFQEEIQALRDINHRLKIKNSYDFALRDILHDMWTVNHIVRANRKYTHISQKMLQQSHAVRWLEQSAIIDRSLSTSALQHVRLLRLWQDDLQAQHRNPRITRIGKPHMQAIHKSNRRTRIYDRMDWGRLLARQYDALVWNSHKLASREIKSETDVFRHGSKADRTIRRHSLLYVPVTRMESVRVHTHAMHQELLIYGSDRDNTHNLTNQIAMHSGSRPFEKAAGVWTPSTLGGWKQSNYGLYIPSAASDRATRTAKQMDTIGESILSSRETDNPTHLLHDVRGHQWDKVTDKSPKVEYPAEFVENMWLSSALEGHSSFAFEDSILGESWINREAYLENDPAAATLIERLLRGIWLDNPVLGERYTKLDATFLEDILAQIGYYGHIMDDIFVGERESVQHGWLEAFLTLAAKSYAHEGWLTSEFFTGVKERIEGLISRELLDGFKDSTHGGILTFSFMGTNDPSHAVYEEFSSLAKADSRASTIDQELMADSLFRPSVIEVENPFGYLEPNKSIIHVGEEGSKKWSSANIDEAILSEKEVHPSTLSTELLAQKASYPSELETDELLADKEAHDSHLEDSITADALQDRMSELCTRYIVAVHPKDRIAALDEMYVWSVRGMHDGHLSELEVDKFAKLVLDEAIIENVMFGTEPERASDLLEHIVSVLKARDTVFVDSLGEGARPTEDWADLFVEHLQMEKEAAQSIVEQYVLAQEQMRDGHLERGIASTKQIKQSLFDQVDELAQGLMYDYTTDIVDHTMNHEEWSGGYAVPEDYDPHDPYNAYYPWAEEFNAEQLGQGKWSALGTNNWSSNGDFNKWTSEDGSDLSGIVKSDIQAEDYVFQTDFQVSEPDGDAVGILFKYENENNHYAFSIQSEAAVSATNMLPMQLYKVINGVRQPIGTAMNPFPYQVGKRYRIELYYISGKLRIKVSGRIQYDMNL
ncbi:hypothetical protein NQ117_09510 [Paenibacillus sp. SC116]|uniref:hypothetical protein n=1 Tax=Paenibacillus sp. SC116 TaxID=2968986 RepID=UPI00215AA283|nr:hypothetical protein [Paenibacillus sp. SC116]MCR8843924.1 hypothetical protein [Paenibacillus sp. SC116]